MTSRGRDDESSGASPWLRLTFVAHAAFAIEVAADILCRPDHRSHIHKVVRPVRRDAGVPRWSYCTGDSGLSYNFPGFKMPLGSSAVFTRRMRSSASPCSARMYG